MELEFKDVCRRVERAVISLKSKEVIEERCLYLLHVVLLFYIVNPQTPRDWTGPQKDFKKEEVQSAFKEYLIFVLCSSTVSFVDLPGDPDQNGMIPQGKHMKYGPDIFNCLQKHMPMDLVFEGKKIKVVQKKMPIALHHLREIRKYDATKIADERLRFIQTKIDQEENEFTEWAVQLSDICDWIVISKMTLTSYIIAWYNEKMKLIKPETRAPCELTINGETISSPPTTMQITSILRSRGFSDLMNMNRQASDYMGCFLYHLEGGQFCPIHKCIHDSRGNQQYVVWNPLKKDLSLKCLRKRDDDGKKRIKLL